MSSENMIDLERVIKVYFDPGTRLNITALNGVELSIPEGNFDVVVGPSGSGKSTLLNILGGFTTATSGVVKIKDRILNTLSNSERSNFRRKNVGVMWQDPSNNVFPGISVMKNILYSLDIHGSNKREGKAKAKEMLREVGLTERENHSVNRLSGGELQRASLICTLVNDPLILLADEPTGSLDLTTSISVMDLLKDMTKEAASTCLIVTHDPLFERVADSVHRLYDGNITGKYEYNQKLTVDEYIEHRLFNLLKGYTAIEGEDAELLIYVQKDGRLQLPEDVLDQIGGSPSEYYNVHVNDDRSILLTPKESSKKK